MGADDCVIQLDFQEYISGLSVMSKGTIEEALEFAFRFYDTEAKGGIHYVPVNVLVAAAVAPAVFADMAPLPP